MRQSEVNDIFMQAVDNKYLDIVKYLITDLDADIDCVDQWGNTPLMTAANNDDLEMVEYFLSLGADISHKNNAGKIAMNLTNKKEIFSLLFIQAEDSINKLANLKPSTTKAEQLAKVQEEWLEFLEAYEKGNVDRILSEYWDVMQALKEFGDKIASKEELSLSNKIHIQKLLNRGWDIDSYVELREAE